MKIHLSSFRLPARKGFALVITMLALVLMAVLLLAFFSRALLNRQIAFSSTNMARTDLMAQAAREIVLGEIRQEIVDGSVTPDSANKLSQNGITLFQPLDKTHARPARLGRDAALATNTPGYTSIAKVSAADTPVRPSGTIQGSAVGIDAPGGNGRFIPKTRWFDAPRLGSQGTLPTWLYLSRGRGVATPTPDEAKAPGSDGYVVGRFAYTVYDVSGRLNANVAGGPAAMASTNKFSLAGLSLSRLDAAFTTNAVDKFVKWRNGGAADSAAAYTAWLTNTAIPGGFLKVKQNHNAFLSRHDLLKAGQDGILPDVPEYFTHASRSSTAPSWRPEANSTNMPNFQSGLASMEYLTKANDAASANRFVPNVRWPSNATVEHYKDDGTKEYYQVKAGEPLIRRPFSLAKLAWLGHSGPASGISDEAIEDCFGLRWKPTEYRWDYIEESSTSPVRIKTLEEVADEEREPNFFELLNAGILQGSLGRDPGQGTDVYGGYGVYSSMYDHYKNEPNLQIFQIGANIIDQYDADSYPTAIRFNAFGLTGADDLSIQTVYGIENLPYLHTLVTIAIADPLPPGVGDMGTLKFWIQPQLWNPHQIPSAPLSDYPAGFRAYAYGRVTPVWNRNLSGGASGYVFGPPTQYDNGLGVQGSPGRPGEVWFHNPGDATSPFYNTPRRLTLDLATTGGVPIVDQANTPPENYYDDKWEHLNATPNEFAGFALMPDESYAPPGDPGAKKTEKFLVPDVNRRAYFSLHYRGPDGNWHPYTFMARMGQTPNSQGKYFRASDQIDSAAGKTAPHGWGPSRSDPRTDRFSCYTLWFLQQGTQNTINTAPGSYSIPSGSGAGGKGDRGAPYRPGFFTYVPLFDPPNQSGNVSGDGVRPGMWAKNDPSDPLSTGQNSYYADPDGVVRYGDSYRQNNTTGDGNQLSHQNNAAASALRRRPVILNRPFRSVGELGYAYRDQPVKTLDLWTPTSADAALLDLFAVADGPDGSADRINPAAAPAAVLKAVFADTWKNETLTAKITDPEAQKLAATISAHAAANPYGNRSDLALLMGPVVSGKSGTQALNTTLNTPAGDPEAAWANKSYAEAPMRALADVADFRTWNLLIDVVAQAGRLSPGASSLQDFVVTGEKRYWLHVAIDRYTGKIMNQQLEPVYE